MRNVENTGNILASSSYVGGIIGSFDIDDEDAEFTFDQLVNRGKLSSTGSYAGGIFGIIWPNNKANTYRNLYNYGDIRGSQCIGGIVGYFPGGTTGDWQESDNFKYKASGPRMMTNTFDSCVSTGNITGTSHYLGGLFGYVVLQAIAAYANTSGNAYITKRCEDNSNISRREADFTFFDVYSIFNLQNSYATGNVTDDGGGNYFGGLIGKLNSRSEVATLKNTVYHFDSECNVTKEEVPFYPSVTRLTQANIKNSYALGTVSSDSSYTGTLFGQLLVKDNATKPNSFKEQMVGEGNDIISTISNLYSVSSLTDKGSAISGFKENKTHLAANNLYTWADGNPNNLVWGTDTSMGGHSTFTFDASGIAVVESDNLIDKLNACVANNQDFSTWTPVSYTLPDSTAVTIPSLDKKPQLTNWVPWEAD